MHLVAFFLQIKPDQEMIGRIAAALLVIVPILVLAGLIILMVPFWFILKKAGFSPWLTLINLIPFGNLILLYIVAFADWKVIPLPQAVYPPHIPYPPQDTQPPYPPQA